ncbi:Hypothetical predicted protein [Lecanosticta acicola]|uniref:Uncharacterized protein n=1 Tax=Lecanosticta acicola TaxID=111012 RepID=A0AAI9ECM0_9PEZI|nr:Hypothetical predicted protein [Lecanosticta acicola]
MLPPESETMLDNAAKSFVSTAAFVQDGFRVFQSTFDLTVLILTKQDQIQRCSAVNSMHIRTLMAALFDIMLVDTPYTDPLESLFVRQAEALECRRGTLRHIDCYANDFHGDLDAAFATAVRHAVVWGCVAGEESMGQGASKRLRDVGFGWRFGSSYRI